VTLATLRTNVRTRLGIPTDDALYSDATLTALLNDGLQFISTEADWYWLEKTETLSLVNGTSAYNVAADCTRTINAADPTGVPLERKPIDELEAMSASTGAVVRFFSPYGLQIHFRPVPNTSISVSHRYIGGETALSGDSDVPLIPTQFQPILVEYAVYLAKQRAGNVDEAKTNLEEYERLITVAKARNLKLAESRGGGQP
jgi:hypothetical protein